MKARPACIHGLRSCGRCHNFTHLLRTAVAERDTRWTPGVLADLNRASCAPTVRKSHP